MESLLTKVKNPADIDTSLIKILIVAVLAIGFAISTGYFLNKLATSYDNSNLIFSGLSILGFLITFTLQTFCIKSKAINWWIVLAETAGILVFFIGPLSITLLATAGVFLLLFLLSANRGSIKELKNQIKIRFFTLSKRIISRTLTALALFFCVVYTGSLYYSGQELFSPKQLRFILAPAEPIIRSMMIENFSLDMTVGSFIEALATKQLGASEIATLQQYPSMKNKLIQDTLDSLQPQAQSFGIILSPYKTVIQTVSEALLTKNLSNTVKNKLGGLPIDISGLLKPIIFSAMGLLLFLTILGVKFLLVFPISLLTWFIYEILIAFGFIKIVYQTQNQELILLA
ncbi:MAG: hypothetical protein PHP03_02380 [Candidatus Pacebacteria bacterium]|nr:hypothetical protein [Candidatus Paceibacterota bacterium]